MCERILAPLDGSGLAERSLAYAEALARRPTSEVILFTVCKPGEALERPFTAYLEKKASELQASGIRARFSIAKGNDAGDEILRAAEREKVDLIALSSHGRSGYKNWAMGKVTTEVLQRSRTPVFLVHSLDPEVEPVPGGFKKILALLDGSKFAEEILPHVQGLAKANQGQVILLRVIEPGGIPQTAAEPVDPTERGARLTTGTEKVVQWYLKEKQLDMERQGCTVSSVILTGKPAQTILQYSEENPVDLIAMATHGVSGIAKWAYGSVASRIIENSPKPVLLIRPPLPAQVDR